ncbi:GNAT family N-acetyltransferase [Natrinema caseinilyticum]|uniref:GNAT family N-acetyltransferase n=1 Tax=Natrinema caseinilyticum TaxID=2961570 RepID=UPI0020C53930|nr:GNAT family N-acetyltransferase [Natrinema caseinilyticum]
MIRRYDPHEDSEELWNLKKQFELELGSNTGGAEKESTYRTKLDGTYRDRYLQWAADCVNNEDCIVLAEVDGEVVGYAFVLPERLAMIWDAAVLNELFIKKSHRGTTVATELMDTVITIAEEQNLPLDRIVLDVDQENDRAQAFYDRYGFEHWGEMVARPL